MEDISKNLKATYTLKTFNVNTGEILQTVCSEKDLIVNNGHQLLAALLGGAGTSGFTATVGWVAVGTNATAPAVTDTTMGTRVARVASTNTLITTSVTNDTLDISASFTFGSTYTLAEIGTFNASAVGTMCTHDAINPTIAVSTTVGLSAVIKIQC